SGGAVRSYGEPPVIRGPLERRQQHGQDEEVDPDLAPHAPLEAFERDGALPVDDELGRRCDRALGHVEEVRSEGRLRARGHRELVEPSARAEMDGAALGDGEAAGLAARERELGRGRLAVYRNPPNLAGAEAREIARVLIG